MASTTAIAWCDATFNPWWGCERVSPACAHCYADTFARRIGMSALWSKRGEHGFRFFGDKHWNEPLRWARKLPEKLGRRPRVFCASMADVFEDHPRLTDGPEREQTPGVGYPMGPRTRLFNLICATPELDWLLLTKRPEFARAWLLDFYDCNDGTGALEDPLENVWVGVSIENARFTWRADVLREIPAAVRFISAEPLLGSLVSVERGRQVPASPPVGIAGAGAEVAGPTESRAPLSLNGIDWLIAGGESGPKHRPMNLDHARELRDACLEQSIAHVPLQRPEEGWRPRTAFFFKQVGGRTPAAGGDELDGREWKEFPTSAADRLPIYTEGVR